MKKGVNQVINEIFTQMTITLTLALDVPVRPMDTKGLISPMNIQNHHLSDFSKDFLREKNLRLSNNNTIVV